MRIAVGLAALAALTALLPVRAQDRADANLYMVEFSFHEPAAPGTAPGDRHYSMLVTDSRKAVFKVGNRTPTVSGSFQPAIANSVANTQFTYIDTGVNIECFLHEAGGKVSLHVAVDLSSVAMDETAAMVAGVRNPVIRQTKLELDSAVALGKPTVIASIVDPATKRTLQVEATVTKPN